MASYDSSFNATGPTVVAFETIDPPGPPPRTFGVGVNGSQVGVHGEGMATPLGTRAVSVSGIGAHGRGDFYGAYGVAGTIPAENAPDLASEPSFPIGVFGVSDSGAASAPAVIGDNGGHKSDMTANPNLGNDMITTIGQASVGVAGVSAAGGGVVGVAGIATPHGHQALDWAVTNLTSNGVVGLNSGVTAVGAGPAPGLYAIAVGGRAGIFETRPSPALVAAQVQLVPLAVGAYTGAEFTPAKTPLVRLPILGQLGDLISVIFTSATGAAPVASLWFCIHSSTGTQNPAQWAEISFGRAVFGNA